MTPPADVEARVDIPDTAGTVEAIAAD